MPANREQTERPMAERGSLVAELLEGKMGETSSSESVSTKLERIANMAKKMPGVPFARFQLG
jgi:hypothetical protein